MGARIAERTTPPGRTAGAGRRPGIAVVVPALDEADELAGLLASVGWGPRGRRSAGDADAADQVVVVDGGSRDATRAVAAAHGARVLASAAGRGGQLALGARSVTADVLLFLHADARVAPGGLAAIRAAFADERVVATGMRQRIDAAGWFYRAVERAANRRVRHGWVYGDSGLAVRRRAYEAAGGFGDQPIFEDVDLSRRLRRLGRIALADAEILVSARRWREEGPWMRTLSNWVLTAGWMAGVPPARLARHYRARRRDVPARAPRRPA